MKLSLLSNIFSPVRYYLTSKHLHASTSIIRTLIISVYLALILGWLISRTGIDAGDWMNEQSIWLLYPGYDGSYFEFFQYVLLGWISFLALRITRLLNERYNPLCLVWLFLLADDLLRLHDGVGARFLKPFATIITSKFTFLNHLVRVKDISEILWWALVLTIIAIGSSFLAMHWKTWNPQILKTNISFFFALAFFGILVDALGANISFTHLGKVGILGNGILTLTEESGELLTIAAAFLYQFQTFIDITHDIEFRHTALQRKRS